MSRYDEVDNAVASLPEMQSVKLKKYRREWRVCPKCGHIPFRLPALLIRWLELPWTHFEIGYCRGGHAPVEKSSVDLPFGKVEQEHRPICAGVTEPHLHVTCQQCHHSFLTKTADATP